MKKAILFSLVIFCLTVKGQKKTVRHSFHQYEHKETFPTAAPVNTLYTFSTFTAAYQPFSGTLLSGGKKWDDTNFTVNLGFNFKLYNVQGTTIHFAEGSFATFDNPLSSLLTLASPMFEDLCDRAFNPNTDLETDPGGISAISYTVEGLVGSRICKVQVENAGFFEEIFVTDTSFSSVNFQLWLYETSNDIEFRFGAVDIQNASLNLQNPSGFICGLGEKVDLNTAGNQSSNLLSGPSANPSMVALTQSVNEVITGAIESGRVYKFSRMNPNLVGMPVAAPLEKFRFFPNPAGKVLCCNFPENEFRNTDVKIYALDGKHVSTKTLQQEMDLSDLEKGAYFLKLNSDNGEEIYTGKLIIVE